MEVEENNRALELEDPDKEHLKIKIEKEGLLGFQKKEDKGKHRGNTE